MDENQWEETSGSAGETKESEGCWGGGYLQLVEQVMHHLAELDDQVFLRVRHQTAGVFQQAAHLLDGRKHSGSDQST